MLFAILKKLPKIRGNTTVQWPKQTATMVQYLDPGHISESISPRYRKDIVRRSGNIRIRQLTGMRLAASSEPKHSENIIKPGGTTKNNARHFPNIANQPLLYILGRVFQKLSYFVAPENPSNSG